MISGHHDRTQNLLPTITNVRLRKYVPAHHAMVQHGSSSPRRAGTPVVLAASFGQVIVVDVIHLKSFGRGER